MVKIFTHHLWRGGRAYGIIDFLSTLLCVRQLMAAAAATAPVVDNFQNALSFMLLLLLLLFFSCGFYFTTMLYELFTAIVCWNKSMCVCVHRRKNINCYGTMRDERERKKIIGPILVKIVYFFFRL